MHPLPRRTLRRLLAQYGPALLDDPARVDALLADLCGVYHAERFLLVYALRERVSDANWPVMYWQGSCSQRLQSRYCFSAEAAQWAAESWSSALNITPPDPSTFRDGGDIRNGRHEELSEFPRRTLGKLLTDNGPDLLKEPARMDALLADLCGEFDRERFLLVHALRERVPSDLLSQRQEGSAAQGLQLTQRLQKRYGFSAKAAQWAVESWSAALHDASLANPPTPKRERKSGPRRMLDRFPLRQAMWLGTGLIGMMVLVFTWQSAVAYAEEGITWLVGIPGLIALGTIAGLLTIYSLGLKKVWRGITWLIRIIWLGLGRMLSRLSLRQKMWLGLGLMAIVALGLEWQSVIAYTEWGIAQLLSIPGWIERMLFPIVDFAKQVIAWLVGLPGLIALGIIAGLLALRSLDPKRAWRGITWLIRIIWLGLGRVLGRLSLRQKMWLGLGLMAIVALGLEWQSVIEYAEWGIAQLLSIPGWIEGNRSQFVDHVAEPVIAWLAGIPGLIALGIIAGLLTLRALGLKGVWRGGTWLIRMTWLGLDRMLSRLSLRQRMWLGLGLMAIVALVLEWQGVIAYTESGNCSATEHTRMD